MRDHAERGVGPGLLGELPQAAGELGAHVCVDLLVVRLIGDRVADVVHGASDGTPVEGATDPAADTPADIGKVQQQLKIIQWVIPAQISAAQRAINNDVRLPGSRGLL